MTQYGVFKNDMSTTRHVHNNTDTDRSNSMSSKDQERWERLAALGVQREIPTPEGEARMSAVIQQVAESFAETARQDTTAGRGDHHGRMGGISGDVSGRESAMGGFRAGPPRRIFDEAA